MPETTDQHTHRSSHREMILEHRFLGDLLQFIWQHFPDDPSPEVMAASVDDNGYDVVLEWRGALRHIQLKGRTGERRYVRVNRILSRKPAGCVVLMTCKRDLTSVSYSWVGSSPAAPLALANYRTAKRLRANHQGVKADTLTTCVVPVTNFTPLPTMTDVVKALFEAEPPSDALPADSDRPLG